MSPVRPLAVVVLAAGEGTRMRSQTPKVLHEIGGRSLLGHALAAAAALEPDHLVAVVRHRRDLVAPHAEQVATELGTRLVVADQDDVKGTGRAVGCGLAGLLATAGVDAGEHPGRTVVVTYGDVPLLAPDTLRELVELREAEQAAAVVLTAVVPDPSGYGRILRDDAGDVLGIVEHKDADAAQRALTEINSGIYAFDAAVLASALGRLSTDNAQGEQYLTDVLGIARADGGRVRALVTGDLWQVEGVNDKAQLAALGAELNRRVLRAWMLAGVTVVDPSTTWVDVQVSLEPDATLLPGVQLHGTTTVATGATVGPDTTLRDTQVGAGADVVRSHALGAVIGERATVGPFAYLRPGTRLGVKGKIGGFVETKNAVIGDGSKVPHLSYVGDAEIGAGSNVGAASVFVNYDGVAKHRITVGDQVRIGSDTMLVAPVSIGDGAYTAAGSVITDDVPPGALGVGRARQRVVEGWTLRRRPDTPAALAAQAALAAVAGHESGTAGQGGDAQGADGVHEGSGASAPGATGAGAPGGQAATDSVADPSSLGPSSPQRAAAGEGAPTA
ncbi:MAG: bifunctional UDP-N-acetylglucosamine diphosphorylase/glucosamine-1-phosphate N-acetyltransferase GlmU [Kineosporiaceae bacterium]